MPEGTQLVRQRPDGVTGASFLEPRSIAWQRGEQRLCDPSFEERVSSVSLDALRERFVGLDPRRVLDHVDDSRRRAHQYQALHHAGSIERELQAQSPTHGVPDVVAGPDVERCRGADEVAVVGQRAGARAGAASSSITGSHEPRCLGEAGYEDEVRAHGDILP